MTPPLPQPSRERWQPLRAGLVDLFYYDSEEFWFRDGRLLLRGNNGTGKSKVLALTLPFLLDGDLSAHRVEPDADPKKRMEWNLLLGGAHPYPERLGYTWLEFGRLDEQGEPVFRTLGCGMKAVSGRGIARHWYYVTERRVGEDLALVDATGTALTRDRLVDALDERGTVYDRARDYRRAVDENLFSFGEQRYGALVDLLVQLRQPQLSKRPSEKALSDALTEALPPLDQAVVADVAEAFRSMEEDRESLRTMTEARDAAASFLADYRRYARIASRRKAKLPREAQSAYERISRELADAKAAFDQADRDLRVAREKLDGLRAERERLQARDQVLRESPEMRDAGELERAAESANRLAKEATRAADARDKAHRQVETRQDRYTVATARLAAAREDLYSARQASSGWAAKAKIAGEHVAHVDGVEAQPREPSVLRREADRIVDRQRRAIEHVSGLIRAVDEAAQKLADARRKVSELDSEADQLAERRGDADRQVAERGGELVSAVRGHLEGATELRLANLAEALAELELWVETLSGPNPVVIAVGAAGQHAANELAQADAGLLAAERAVHERIAEITEEISRLERGGDEAPPSPHTRDDAARLGRPGAPLWQLVDFLDEVNGEDRAGIEAGLEAAGVLDAWLTPDGELIAPDTEDVVLRSGEPVAVHLGAVLRPALDRENPRAAAVSDGTVARLLSSIGWGEHGRTWVGPDGRFRIGVLEGAWRKPVAKYIGRGAREAARRARLVELSQERAALESEATKIETERQRVDKRKAKLAKEITGLPGDTVLREAQARVGSMVEEHKRLTARQARTVEEVRRATSAEDESRTALDDGALDADLPANTAELSEVTDALNEYRISLGALWPAIRGLHDAQRSAEEAAGDLERAMETADELAERAGEAAHEAAAAAERHRTLGETVGAGVAELQRRLAEVAVLVKANESAQDTANIEAGEAIGARGRAEGRRGELTGQLEQATEERASAAEAFRRFAATGLLGVALPELDVADPGPNWAPDPTVRLARRVNDELSDVDVGDDAWERAQRRLNEELKSLHDTLSRHGNRASADLREDGVLVEVEFQGRPTTVPALTEALVTEVMNRERLLNEREREILENHLVNEVASTLQELITEAEYRVRQMNDELEARPTSTGMRLRLVWKPREDGPAGLPAARDRLLRQTSDAWSEDDRAAVGAFLQTRIAEVRARDTAGTWLEHLTEALDYRGWHRFLIERHQNGQWRSATGPASGGERVLAASVPLFAAAASHYRSAGNQYAPRLVTLDEAFAGVDDNARAKYLGLLAAFDLDVVMTSEREWGCYPEVPGLAISQLSRVDGVAAVLVTNWEWDGVGRSRVDRDSRFAAI